MKTIYIKTLFTILFILSCIFTRGQGCADSSVHLRYILNDSINCLNQVRMNDGGRVQLLRPDYFVTGLGYQSKNEQVVRYDPQNKVEWAKEIKNTNPASRVSIDEIFDLNNGNFITSGFSFEPTGEKYFYTGLFSASGNFISQKKIEFRNTGDAVPFTTQNKYNYTICRNSTDSLLFIFFVDDDGGTRGEKICLLSTDLNGTTGWGQFFMASSIADDQFDIWKAKVINNTLWLYGAAHVNAQNPCYPGPGPYLNSGNIIAIAIDLNSRQVIAQKAYCPPVIGTLNTYTGSLWPNYQPVTGGGLASTKGNDYDQDIFFLDNGNIAVTRSYLRSTSNPEPINWLFSISYFDAAFNPIKSELVTTGPLFLNKTLQEIDIDPRGNKHFRFSDYGQNTVYYAVADSNNSWLAQKKITGDWAFSYPSDARLNIPRPGTLTSFGVQSTNLTKTFYDYFEIQQKDISSSCFGIDTSFLTIRSGDVYTSPFAGNFISWPASIYEYPADFYTTDIPVVRETICVEKEICDTLKIHGPDTVCDIVDPVTITAYKNPLCNGEIIFQFDTTAVSKYIQADDTTLILTFNKSWSGKIYAMSSSCPALKDSLSLFISNPLTGINIGSDTVFCPGHVYQLRAPAGFKEYRWQDNSSDSIFVTAEPGKYFVTVTDQCNRVYSDTVEIKINPFALFAGRDTSICVNDRVELQASPGFTNYSWSPSDHMSNPDVKDVIVFPDITTSYVVKAESLSGCEMKDTVVVNVKDCPLNFYIPSAFTPNNDGKNDQFKPIITGAVENYSFSIYNRWGQIVFKSSDKNIGWDGKLYGKVQGGGVYVWMCSYKFYGQASRSTRGTVLLIE